MARFIREPKRGGRSAEVDPAQIFMAATSKQKQPEKTKSGDAPDEGESGEADQKMAKKGEDIKEEMDSLLDEIDAVLEENAEEFVKNYVQRGGE